MKNMFFFFLENKRRNIFSFFPWKQKEKNGFRIRSFIHDLRWANWVMKQESKSESNRNLFFFLSISVFKHGILRSKPELNSNPAQTDAPSHLQDRKFY